MSHSVHLCNCPYYRRHNTSLMDEQILAKLNTVLVYDLRMCMKEDNLGPKNIMGDNCLCGTR